MVQLVDGLVVHRGCITVVFLSLRLVLVIGQLKLLSRGAEMHGSSIMIFTKGRGDELCNP